MTDNELWLAFALTLGFLTEAAAGFGSTLVVVGLAAQIIPLTTLLPAYQPLALVLSLMIVLRRRHDVDLAFLGRAVLPAMIPGLVVGMALFRLAKPDALLAVVGLGIVTLALVELRRLLLGGAPSTAHPLAVRAALAFAGLIHGLFGTSGPIVVWAASQTLSGKERFRATLGLLWLILSAVLVVGFVADGSINGDQLWQTVKLSPTLVVGFVVGNQIHKRVSERAFRLTICAMLILAGMSLTARGLAH